MKGKNVVCFTGKTGLGARVMGELIRSACLIIEDMRIVHIFYGFFYV
jgi:hypothetical protein